MSELKARGVDDVYIEYYNTGKHELSQVYLKSEADKVIARNKHKRCLAMAKWSDASYYQYPSFGEISPKEEWWQKWHVRWLELAEKFKEAK